MDYPTLVPFPPPRRRLLFSLSPSLPLSSPLLFLLFLDTKDIRLQCPPAYRYGTHETVGWDRDATGKIFKMRQDKRPRQSSAAVDRHSRMHNIGQVDLMIHVLLFAGRDDADTSEQCRISSRCVASSGVVISERAILPTFVKPLCFFQLNNCTK